MPLGYSRRNIHFTKSEKKNFGNPFRFRRISSTSRVSAIIGGGLFVVLLSVCYWLLYSSGFDIRTITLDGTTAVISRDQLQEILQARFSNTRVHSIPERNIFAFNTRELAKTLKMRFALDAVLIKKKLPHSLMIQITEKPREAIWSTKNTYFAIDGEGKILHAISPPALPQTETPIIFDLQSEEVQIQEQVLTPEMSAFISKLLAAEYIQGLHPQFFLLPKRVGTDLILKTGEGWKLYINAADSVEDQLHYLTLTLQNSIPQEKRSALEYVDLRFGERVYFKYR